MAGHRSCYSNRLEAMEREYVSRDFWPTRLTPYSPVFVPFCPRLPPSFRHSPSPILPLKAVEGSVLPCLLLPQSSTSMLWRRRRDRYPAHSTRTCAGWSRGRASLKRYIRPLRAFVLHTRQSPFRVKPRNCCVTSHTRAVFTSNHPKTREGAGWVARMETDAV